MAGIAVPTATALSAVRRVELIHTGRWAVSSGTWNASREDLAAAVAALDCPSVRRPVLKLGHSKGETPLWAGNPTGAPAVGWVDNLATTNQGHTLLGDFVGMPGWLGDVAASAYPDRSVEGSYDFRCQAGHTHPFVLTAVALLGVTPPGVGTLRSLQDVGALYGVHAVGGGTQVVARFDPSQPRDEHGRWTDGPPGTLDVPERVLGILTRQVAEGDQPQARQLAAEAYDSGHREGAEDLLIDLWDSGEIDAEVVEWAVAHGLPDVRNETGDTSQRDARRDAQIDRLTALLGDETDAADTFEDISDRGARDGLSDVLADMWQAGMVTVDTVEFAIENNGAADPRGRRSTTRRLDAAAAGSHVEGLTLGGSGVDVDLWSDGTVTLGWGGYETTLGLAASERLVAAFNRVRGGQPTAAVPTGDVALRLAARSGGDIDLSAGSDRVLLSDDDAFDLQTQLVEWLTPDGDQPDGVQARRFDPARHPRWPKGTPGGLGGRFMPRDLVPRLSGASQSRSARRATPPARQRRTRTGTARADSTQTRQALDTLVDEVAQVPGTGTPTGSTASLVETVRSIRRRVADGDTSPDEAMQQVSQLILHPDVASDPRLGDAVNRAVGRIRDGAGQPQTPTTRTAGRAPAPGGFSPAAVAERLRSAGGRDQAREVLSRLTAAQLRAAADEIGAAYGSSWRKQRVADSIVQVAVGFRERSESIMRGGGGPGFTGPVQAAADLRTGAMVALLPTEEDRLRLAVDGGEDPDQLHATLLFLGEAAAYPQEVREALVAELREVAEVVPPGGADGFAVAAFNPDSIRRDTAIVLELGGDGLEDVHGLVEVAVDEVAGEAGLILPDQHTPWRPHVTLVYTDDLRRVVELADRTGPVRFDRLRLSFAGENVDIPLTGEGSDLDVENLTDDDMPLVDGGGQVVAQQSRRVTRSDRPLRRYWLRGAGAAKIRWNTPGDWTRCVRQLRRYVRDPKGLCAVYHRAATGVWPGDRRNVGRVNAAFDPDQPRDDDGRWTDTMHTATPDEIASFRERFGKAIPPAWTDVQIADDLDNAPLLVAGRDAKGRRQAIYSAEHTQHQAAKKFARVQALDGHLDKLDHALERDAGVNDDAAALLLIRKLGMRPGSTRDTQASTRAYGATTLLAEHVTVADGRAVLEFTGKKGVHIRLETAAPTVVDALSRRLASRSGTDRLFGTTEARTREYMHSTGVPREFLLKDLRTVHANVVALREIAKAPDPPASKREFQRRRREVAEVVSRALGNTPTLALSSYINPTVFTAWVGDPAWVAAAAGDLGGAAICRAEEKRLLHAWFATVTFDRPETGIPPVEPDPEDEDDDGRTVTATIEEAIMPNPNPTIVGAAAAVSVDDVRTAYHRQAPQQAWIREFHTQPKRLIVANDADGSVARVDFDIADDGSISFSQPVPVRVEYVEEGDDRERVAASRMVYASRAESRPDIVTSPPTPPGFEPKDVQAAEVSNRPWSDFDESDYTPEQWRRATLLDRGESAGDADTKGRYGLPVREPDGTLNRNGVHAAAGGHGIGAVKGISDELRRLTARKIVRLYRDELDETPPDSLLELAGMSTSAAAPTTDPHQTPAAEPGNPSTKEDDMPLSTEVYQRLGLAEDADEATVNAAVLALADKADKAPDPQQVAAAAAEKDDLTKEVGLLKGQVEAMSAKLSAAEEEKAATVKASVLDAAADAGKFAPADRGKWEADYDAAPAVVTRVLASIAPGAAVPVGVQGTVGDLQAAAGDELAPEPEWLFSNPTPALAGATSKEN